MSFLKEVTESLSDVLMLMLHSICNSRTFGLEQIGRHAEACGAGALHPFLDERVLAQLDDPRRHCDLLHSVHPRTLMIRTP
jgi:hypothetical protein